LLPCLYMEIVLDRRFLGRWYHARNITIRAVRRADKRPRSASSPARIVPSVFEFHAYREGYTAAC
jgi:hypothetical protein